MTRVVKTCVSVFYGVVLSLSVGRAADYIVGADLSFSKQAEDQSSVFKDNGVAKPVLQIFKDHGYNWVRLRIFNNPAEPPNSLPYTVTLAQAAKKLGYKFLLDFITPTHGLTRRSKPFQRTGTE